MSITIHHTSALDWAAAYDGPLFHALLCDPPYHLTSITERFGGVESAPAQFGSDGAFARASRGFMGRNWDGGDLAFRPETWAAFGRLLHPGAFGMAFASTRGFHRMAVAIEDAGFIIHPTIFCWAFGSGFPKATRLDVQIDRAAGVEPTIIGQKKHAPKWAAAEFGYREKDNGYNSRERESFDLTAPATPLAQAWAGHRYGLQALKPALEPIIVFQKPYQGRPVDCITRTGAGALNIDAGRIGRADDDRFNYGVDGDERGNANRVYGAIGAAPYTPHDAGRWPANLILSHHPECNGHCVEACPVRRLGEQSGESSSGGRTSRAGDSAHTTWRQMENRADNFTRATDYDMEGSTGTAARYFYNADWMTERLEDADPLIYQAKASTAEREAGLDDFEPTTVDDGRDKPIDNAYLRGETKRRNIHPTIKPIALARHLATLLLPPDLYAPRRLFVPFAGVASEMIGAMLAGWEHIDGVELEADHIPIARARLDYWQQRRWELMNPAAEITVKAAPKAPAGQIDMFAEEAA